MIIIIIFYFSTVLDKLKYMKMIEIEISLRVVVLEGRFRLGSSFHNLLESGSHRLAPYDNFGNFPEFFFFVCIFFVLYYNQQ